jgi:GT2 family glycosyltransferase
MPACALSHNTGGSIIGLINNDIDVINSNWLSEMVSLASIADVGAVGAKLIYPNNRVQHAGIVLGVGGVANHLNHAMSRSAIGYYGCNVLASSVSAVTGACLVVRRSVFEEVGGLNETDLAVAFNDVDFCLRVSKKGYQNVWTLTPNSTITNLPAGGTRIRRERESSSGVKSITSWPLGVTTSRPIHSD